MCSWTSAVYDHYTVSLEWHVTEDNLPSHIDFVFTCHTHPENHPDPRIRARQKPGHGTTSLAKDVQMCEKKQGIQHPKPTSTISSPKYSDAHYHALLVLRCAKEACPINMILDDDYQKEVEMLCPGTVPPHPTTIQWDLISIYTHWSLYIVNFFVVSHGYYDFKNIFNHPLSGNQQCNTHCSWWVDGTPCCFISRNYSCLVPGWFASSCCSWVYLV